MGFERRYKPLGRTETALGSIDTLSDVTITSATTGDLLRFDGAAWINYPDSNYAAASHTHLETEITDGALLARLADTETITGSWTFNSQVTLGDGDSTAGDVLLYFNTDRAWSFEVFGEGSTADLSLVAQTNGKFFTIRDAADIAQFQFLTVDTTPYFRAYDATGTDYIQITGSTTQAVIESTQHIQLTPATGHEVFVYDPGTAAVFAVYDGTGNDAGKFSHNGTDFYLSLTNTDWWRVNGITNGILLQDGPEVRIYDDTNADYAAFAHSGTNFSTSFTNTDDWRISGLSGGIAHLTSSGYFAEYVTVGELVASSADGWCRIARNAGSTGRGGAVIWISGVGGTSAPDPMKITVHGTYNAGPASIKVECGAYPASIVSVRSGYDATNVKYIDIQVSNVGDSTFVIKCEAFGINTGSSSCWVADPNTTAFTPTSSYTVDADNIVWGHYNEDASAQYFFSDTSAEKSLTIASSEGDAAIYLKADTDNSTESDNPFIRFEQDNNSVNAVIGLSGGVNVDAQGSTFTGGSDNALVIHAPYTSSFVELGVGGVRGLRIDTNERVYMSTDSIGYFTAVTGNYGSVQVAGNEGSSGGYAGFSVNGRLVLMNNNSTIGGLYDDTNNEWFIRCTENADVELHYNGALVTQTLPATSGGLQVNNTSTGAGFERVLTTSDLGGGGGFGDPKVKTSTTSRSSTTTLADDPHLLGWSLTANKHYAVIGHLTYIAANITPDIKFNWVWTNAPADAGDWGLLQTDDAKVLQEADSESPMTTAMTALDIASREQTAWIHGHFKANATTGGTVDFQWAQNTSSATATQLLAGSWISLVQLD